MAKVVLENVYKAFPSRSGAATLPSPDASSGLVPILKNINLTIHDGEFLVLVGPSGCGKSTLLRLIAGLETVTAGKIRVNDRPVQDLPPKARDIAMVFQSYALYPHLSVYDNIAFGLRRRNPGEQSDRLREPSKTGTAGAKAIGASDSPVLAPRSIEPSPSLPNLSPRPGETLPQAAPPSGPETASAVYPLPSQDSQAFPDRRDRPGPQPLPRSTPAKARTPKSPLQSWQHWGQQLRFAATRSLPAPLRYIPPQEAAIQALVHQVAQMLQIEALLQRFPRQLSGGQKQRVALGRAIARNPQVFLMDEPLSNLDAQLRAETRSQIVQLQRQLGTTTIYVTHDQVEAMTMGQRIALMNQGQLEQVATPLELYRTPATRFVASFIGSPPMNFITVQLKSPATIVHDQFRFTLPTPWLPAIQPHLEQTVVLGIRPEHFDLGGSAVKNLPVVIDRIESLGSDTYLTVHLIETSELLQVRVDPEKQFIVGQMIHLSIRIEHLHLFDAQSDRAIAHGPVLA